jgi:hypothetical protein
MRALISKFKLKAIYLLFPLSMLAIVIVYLLSGNGKVSGKFEMSYDFPMRRDGRTIGWQVAPSEAAVILVDVWSNHWCSDLLARINAKAPRIGEFVDLARRKGFLIIHAVGAPIMHYKTNPSVIRMKKLPNVKMPKPSYVEFPAATYAYRGMKRVRCITGESAHRIVPLKQHDAVRITPDDFMVSSGKQLWKVVKDRELKYLFYLGFATNNCVIHRSYGMLPMRSLGLETAIIRDFTDLQFTVVDPPMSNEEATDLYVRHIEKYLGPSITSEEMVSVIMGRTTESAILDASKQADN